MKVIGLWNTASILFAHASLSLSTSQSAAKSAAGTSMATGVNVVDVESGGEITTLSLVNGGNSRGSWRADPQFASFLEQPGAIIGQELHQALAQVHTEIRENHEARLKSLEAANVTEDQFDIIERMHRQWAEQDAEEVDSSMVRIDQHGLRHIPAAMLQEKEFDFDEDMRTGPVQDVDLVNIKNSQYMGWIQVGTPPVRIRVVFDTGSTNMWVGSVRCNDGSCLRMPERYDDTKSSTSNPYNWNKDTCAEPKYTPYWVHIKFGTGELEGNTVKDDISLGDLKIKSQVFGMIEKETGSIFRELPFGGIFGLAFPSMAAGGYTPIFDRIIEQKLLTGKKHHNEFSMYMNPSNSEFSALMLGGVDSRVIDGPVHIVKTTDNHYWATKLLRLYYGDQLIENTAPKLIFDTGTTLNTAPKDMINKMLALTPNTKCSEINKMKSWRYVVEGLDGTEVEFEIPPEFYYTNGGAEMCNPGLWPINVPKPHGPAHLFGELFMRRHVTVYRRENGDKPAVIAVARAKHDPSFLDTLIGNAHPSDRDELHIPLPTPVTDVESFISQSRFQTHDHSKVSKDAVSELETLAANFKKARRYKAEESRLMDHNDLETSSIELSSFSSTIELDSTTEKEPSKFSLNRQRASVE